MSDPTDDDLGGFLTALNQMQQQLNEAQDEANARTVVGRAAQGAVQITVSGEFSYERVTIDPSIVDPNDCSLLEDLVLAALRDGVTQLKTMQRATVGGVVADAMSRLFPEDGSVPPPTLSTDDDKGRDAGIF